MNLFKKERIIQLDRSESTNDDALAMMQKSKDPCLVWTLYQTKGRGSRGREWVSPRHSVLCLSVGFTSKQGPHPGEFCYPLFAGVWLHRTLTLLYPSASFRLKWPNDVLLYDKKVAGILCESQMTGRDIRIVVGVGINLRKHSLLDRLPKPYNFLGSLKEEHPPEQIIGLLEKTWWACLEDCFKNELSKEWEVLSNVPTGYMVEGTIGDELYEGIYRGVTNDGAFILESSDGTHYLRRHFDDLEFRSPYATTKKRGGNASNN